MQLSITQNISPLLIGSKLPANSTDVDQIWKMRGLEPRGITSYSILHLLLSFIQ